MFWDFVIVMKGLIDIPPAMIADLSSPWEIHRLSSFFPLSCLAFRNLDRAISHGLGLTFGDPRLQQAMPSSTTNGHERCVAFLFTPKLLSSVLSEYGNDKCSIINFSQSRSVTD